MAQKKRQLLRKNYADIKEVYSGITEEDKAFLTLYQSQEDKFSYLVGKKRKEATQQEKRQFAKQFLEAKQAECKSWFDNDVFELVDMRKLRIRNYVAGRWVLTIKKDKDGNFLKRKARWVLKGFQDRQKDTQQTGSPAASRSGFRCATQFAANCQWDLYHMDLKTAFLQGEAYDETRDIICQIPSECGYPPHIGAKMKKSAYGLNDAPRRCGRLSIKHFSAMDLRQLELIDAPIFCTAIRCHRRTRRCPSHSGRRLRPMILSKMLSTCCWIL